MVSSVSRWKISFRCVYDSSQSPWSHLQQPLKAGYLCRAVWGSSRFPCIFFSPKSVKGSLYFGAQPLLGWFCGRGYWIWSNPEALVRDRVSVCLCSVCMMASPASELGSLMLTLGSSLATLEGFASKARLRSSCLPLELLDTSRKFHGDR